MKKLFVGNLPWTVTEDELRDLFAQHGTVHSAVIVLDRETGRSRGFGFVEMDEAEANTAIESVNGMDLGGRPVRVDHAQERQSRGSGGGW